MANIDIANYDLGSVVIKNPEFETSVIAFAGADTLAEGTIMGRITASGKWIQYTSGASDGSQIPKGVLITEEVATGVGDIATRILIKGTVRADKLIADGVGDPTQAELDQLRDYGIIALDTTDISLQDNQ